MTSVIACENTNAGDPPTDWQVTGAGDPTLQGYATAMSVNAGQSISFKILSTASSYHFDILRLGYYQGNGARKIASALSPSVPYPQSQPSCLTDSTTGLIDCGNWAVSASWAVPANAVSGLYVAHLNRDDNKGESQIPFVVRNDGVASNIVFQTSDETWEAYNSYGGNSLYTCSVACPPGNPSTYKAAYKVSYNRPFHTASDDAGRSWFMYSELPMIEFMEANGYDLTYLAATDVDSNASLLLNHKVFMSTGHDEYWSANQRANVQAARDQGVSLAFFSGNEMFWKTRFEASHDGSNTAGRTLVTYKETHFTSPVDPADPPTWSGSWEDPRFSPPADGGAPANALTGQKFAVNSGTTDIQVTASYAKLRLWRNTAVANLTGTGKLTLGQGLGTLGYEWDVDADNGFRPPGLFDLSSTTLTTAEVFTDYGSTVQSPSTATHHLTMYKAASGALVFGAGTVQWSWGLNNETTGGATDTNMQQATVNVLADMGAQPASLISGLVAATPSTDTTPPTSQITSPAAGAGLADGSTVTIQGTAADTGGGVVAGVEVSTDGGTTWHPATGTTSWSYTWVAHGNPSTTILSRAADDSGNVETPSAGISVNVACACSIWGAGMTPGQADSGDGAAVNVGFKFSSDVAGTVTGIRFYKASTNTGTHVGSLWSSSGSLLASATFTGESASGWQQVSLSSPVAISAGTTYVASYLAPVGHYSDDGNYFFGSPPPPDQRFSFLNSPPLHAGRSTPSSANGLYAYSSSTTFPTSSYNATNYWVDVVFNPGGAATAPGAPTNVAATAGNGSATVTWNAPSNGGSVITAYTVTPFVGTTAQTATVVSGSPPATSVVIAGLTNGTTYTFTVSATNAIGTGSASAASNAVTPSSSSSGCPCTILGSSTPATIDAGDANSVNLGVKFNSSSAGNITGIRFYKASTNTGTHVGSLWSSTGALLGSAAFNGETASGWQQVNFSSPVAITAGTTYVASYLAPAGHYSSTSNGFGSAVSSPPLTALANSTSPNGVYTYATSNTFPSSSFNATNYWVDVVFNPSGGTATVPGAPSNVAAAAGNASATVTWTAPSNGGSVITAYTVTPFIGTTAQAATIVSGSPPATSATITGLTNGTTYTFNVSASNAIGTGPASSASNAVTPAAAATVPGTPTNVAASAGNGSATVSWTAPANGGSPITSYTITPYLGSTPQTPRVITGSPPATSTKVTGLTNGKSYTFTVKATNSVGTGPESAHSNAVTPKCPLLCL